MGIVGIVRRRRRGISNDVVHRGRGRGRFGKVPAIPGRGGKRRGRLVIDRGRRRLIPNSRSRRRLISGRGSRRVVGRGSAGIAVTLFEDAVLSTVKETPLTGAEVRRVFDAAQNGGDLLEVVGGIILRVGHL